MYPRYIQPVLVNAFRDTPVIVLNGARQTGKSTLCQELIAQNRIPAHYVTFDDPTALSAAQGDPVAFLEGLSDWVVMDEVQRMPELFPFIKRVVDRNRKTRRFLLTGSADVMVLPQISESLAGRSEVHHLWPLSQGEILGRASTFLVRLTAESSTFNVSNTPWVDLVRLMVMGGYPEPLGRDSERRREAWFGSYINAILQKDIRELANIEGLVHIPRLLDLIAGRVGNIVNLADISRVASIPQSTLQRYYALLQQVMLVVQLPAWTPNREGRVAKAPKVFLNDTGLLCYLRGEGMGSLQQNRTSAGPILENFVVMEIIKQLSWSDVSLRPYHFRTHKGQEVDLVLESRKKEVYGLEVKTAMSVESSDFKGLRYLKKGNPSKFRKGVVLYTGEQIIKFEKDLFAVPISALWAK